MIVRNAAVRFGRRSIASPVPKSLLRQLSTNETSNVERLGNAQSLVAISDWSADQASPQRPKVTSVGRKAQKVTQNNILSLASDSAHEHKGAAWTKPHSTPNSAAPANAAEQYNEFRRIQSNTRGLGSQLEKRYIPTELVNNPPGPQDVTLELLMASQTHMGHSTSLWNPANSRYIHGVRQGIHIISLETTAAHLRRAARVVEEVSYKGGLILFVGTRKGQMEIVTKAAELSGSCHLFTKWTPGGITNRDVIFANGSMKVVDQHDNELEDFAKFRTVARPLLPDLVICLNPLENYTLLYECGLKSIPTIGVIDTNADPSWVTYTIPANDDSLRAMAVVGGVLGRAGEIGKNRRLADAKKNKVAWENPEEVQRYMSREVKAALAERKAVMGRIQANLEGFTEEEQNILRSQYAVEDMQVSEDEMVALMGQAADGKAPSPPKKSNLQTEDEMLKSLEEVVSAEDVGAVAGVGSSGLPSLESLEEQLAHLTRNTVAIEAEIRPSSSSGASVTSLEEQISGLQKSVAAIEAEIKGAGEQK